MPAGEEFDREVERRANQRQQAIAEQRAALSEAEALRQRQQDEQRHKAEDLWQQSQDLRQWAARRLSEANAPAKQLIVREHWTEKKRLFGKPESIHVIDEAVDGWRIAGREGDFFEARDAIYEDLTLTSPVIWRITYLLSDSSLAVTFVRVTSANRISFAYSHDHAPSASVVPREIRVIRDSAQFAALTKSDPNYSIPGEDYFISRVDEAGRGK